LSTSVWPPEPMGVENANRIQQLAVFGGFREQVEGLSFSADSKLLAVGSWGRAAVLQLPEGRELLRARRKTNVAALG
jgi:hypothetical protein